MRWIPLPANGQQDDVTRFHKTLQHFPTITHQWWAWLGALSGPGDKPFRTLSPQFTCSRGAADPGCAAPPVWGQEVHAEGGVCWSALLAPDGGLGAPVKGRVDTLLLCRPCSPGWHEGGHATGRCMARAQPVQGCSAGAMSGAPLPSQHPWGAELPRGCAALQSHRCLGCRARRLHLPIAT